MYLGLAHLSIATFTNLVQSQWSSDFLPCPAEHLLHTVSEQSSGSISHSRDSPSAACPFHPISCGLCLPPGASATQASFLLPEAWPRGRVLLGSISCLLLFPFWLRLCCGFCQRSCQSPSLFCAGGFSLISSQVQDGALICILTSSPDSAVLMQVIRTFREDVSAIFFLFFF